MNESSSVKKLWVLNLETQKSKIIWDTEENNEFVKRQINWLSDNENIIVLLAKLDKNGKNSDGILVQEAQSEQENLRLPKEKEK